MTNLDIDLSIVILTWNSERYITRCIDSIIYCLSGHVRSCEIYVVDNGSKDQSLKKLNGLIIEKPFNLHLIALKENKGTTVSRNLALRKVKGEYVCIMDSDVEVGQDVFSELITILANDESIVLVVPKIFYPSGNWQKSFDRFPTISHKIKRLFCLRSMEASEGAIEISASNCKDVDYAISAFWLFRRSLLEKVGLLDENIFYAPEDVDFCLRIWRAGYRIVYQPSVNIIHHTQEISRGFKLNKAKFEHLKGLIYFYKKYRYNFKRPKSMR